LQFRYILIDIRNLNGERLLESQTLNDQALALLCDNVTRRR